MTTLVVTGELKLASVEVLGAPSKKESFVLTIKVSSFAPSQNRARAFVPMMIVTGLLSLHRRARRPLSRQART